MRSKLTVDVPAESRNLTVLDTLKRELGITDASQDEKLADYICAASDIVAAYCDRVFAQETVVETFWPNHFRSFECIDTIILARTPIQKIFSVTHDGSLLAATDFDFDADTGLLYRLAPPLDPFHWMMFGSVEVEYSGGYLLLDGLPRGIERATILMCKDMHYSGQRDPRIKTESTPGIYSVDYWVGSLAGTSTELPPDVMALLAPYKRYVA